MMMMMMMMMMNDWWWCIDGNIDWIFNYWWLNLMMLMMLMAPWCQHDRHLHYAWWMDGATFASVSPQRSPFAGIRHLCCLFVISYPSVFHIKVVSYHIKSCSLPWLSKASELELLKKQLGMEPRTSGSTRDWKAEKVEEHQFLWVKCKVCLLTCCCRSKDS